MAEQTVLITGANGRTGRQVIRALAAAGVRTRAFIRRAEQQSSLLAEGAAECAVGDLADASSLHAALAGCDAVVHIGPPMHPLEVEFVTNVIDAARANRVGHFIYYSVMHPLRREVRHHRLKLDAEEQLVESGLAFTIVQPCRYMQHLEPIWKTVTEQGVHRMPFSTAQGFSVVDLADLAEAVAIIVTQGSRHHFATYELAGPQVLSQEDMAKTLSETLGRAVRAEAVSMDALRAAASAKGLDNDRVEQMVVMNQHYDRHGFPGNGNVLTWLLGRAPTTYRDYVRRLAMQL